MAARPLARWRVLVLRGTPEAGAGLPVPSPSLAPTHPGVEQRGRSSYGRSPRGCRSWSSPARPRSSRLSPSAPAAPCSRCRCSRSPSAWPPPRSAASYHRVEGPLAGGAVLLLPAPGADHWAASSTRGARVWFAMRAPLRGVVRRLEAAGALPVRRGRAGPGSSSCCCRWRGSSGRGAVRRGPLRATCRCSARRFALVFLGRELARLAARAGRLRTQARGRGGIRPRRVPSDRDLARQRHPFGARARGHDRGTTTPTSTRGSGCGRRATATSLAARGARAAHLPRGALYATRRACRARTSTSAPCTRRWGSSARRPRSRVREAKLRIVAPDHLEARLSLRLPAPARGRSRGRESPATRPPPASIRDELSPRGGAARQKPASCSGRGSDARAAFARARRARRRQAHWTRSSERREARSWRERQAWSLAASIDRLSGTRSRARSRPALIPATPGTPAGAGATCADARRRAGRAPDGSRRR